MEALLGHFKGPKIAPKRETFVKNGGAARNLFKRRTGSALHLKDVTESQTIVDRLAGGSDLRVVESRTVGSDLVESRTVGSDFTVV